MWTTDCYERFSRDHPFLNEFAKGMVRYFHKAFMIPVYPVSITSSSIGGDLSGVVRILHCHYGTELRDNDWEVMGNIGREFANGFYYDGGSAGTVDWMPSAPSEWHLTGFS